MRLMRQYTVEEREREHYAAHGQAVFRIAVWKVGVPREERGDSQVTRALRDKKKKSCQKKRSSPRRGRRWSGHARSASCKLVPGHIHSARTHISEYEDTYIVAPGHTYGSDSSACWHANSVRRQRLMSREGEREGGSDGERERLLYTTRREQCQTTATAVEATAVEARVLQPWKRACCSNSHEQGHTYIQVPGHLCTSTWTHTSTRWSAHIVVVRGNIYSSTCEPQPNCDMRKRERVE